ncbi:MAG: ImmA/IrrE family metallo-endopeptidase [Patescibacteria group bacterium]|nr:ImmA/IrrE family metallo-endopeptidase [Patescibacteria group bacterium]
MSLSQSYYLPFPHPLAKVFTLMNEVETHIIDHVDRILKDNYVVAPPVAIDELAGNYNFELIQADFKDYANKIAGFIDADTIYINKIDSKDRQAVNIAILLGRYILNKDKITSDGSLNILRRIPLGEMETPIEKESVFFAAHLLIPESLLEKYKNESAHTLAKIFGVPDDFLGYRLHLEFGHEGAQKKYA